MKLFITIALCVLWGLAATAEPAPPAPKGFDALMGITGFHSHHDKGSGFEIRILEVDGSATVAMNPVSLYLVATSNASGEDLQSRIVELPKVAGIKRIRFFDEADVIRIEASFDCSDESGSEHWTVSGTLEISIPIKDGKLPAAIEVKRRESEERGARGPQSKPEGEKK